jgi:hypothetical protein
MTDPMTDLFGRTPRVRLLAALIRLGPVEVTRAEIAQEAGLFKTSANRAIARLVKDKLVRRASGGSRPLYRVNSELAQMRLLGYLDAALGTLARGEQDARQVLDIFRTSSLWVVESVSLESDATPSIDSSHSVGAEGFTEEIPGLLTAASAQSLTLGRVPLEQG